MVRGEFPPSSAGSVPLKRFLCTSSSRIDPRRPRDAGREPDRLVCTSQSDWTRLRLPNWEGMVPEILGLLAKEVYKRESARLPSSVGKVPDSAGLTCAKMALAFVSVPSSVGSVPLSDV